MRRKGPAFISESIFELISYTLEKKSCSYEVPCNVSTYGELVCLELEVPSLDMERLQVTVFNNEVVVRGIKKRSTPYGARYLRAERMLGYFKKRVEIPFQVEGMKKIEYKNGVLKLTFVKREVESL